MDISKILKEFADKETFIIIKDIEPHDYGKLGIAINKIFDYCYDYFKDDSENLKIVIKDQEMDSTIEDTTMLNMGYLTRHGNTTTIYLSDVDLYEEQIIIALDDYDKNYGGELNPAEPDVCPFKCASNMDEILDELIKYEIEEFIPEGSSEEIIEEEYTEDEEDLDKELASVLRKMIKRELKEILIEIINEI